MKGSRRIFSVWEMPALPAVLSYNTRSRIETKLIGNENFEPWWCSFNKPEPMSRKEQHVWIIIVQSLVCPAEKIMWYKAGHCWGQKEMKAARMKNDQNWDKMEWAWGMAVKGSSCFQRPLEKRDFTQLTVTDGSEQPRGWNRILSRCSQFWEEEKYPTKFSFAVRYPGYWNKFHLFSCINTSGAHQKPIIVSEKHEANCSISSDEVSILDGT